LNGVTEPQSNRQLPLAAIVTYGGNARIRRKANPVKQPCSASLPAFQSGRSNFQCAYCHKLP